MKVFRISLFFLLLVQQLTFSEVDNPLPDIFDDAVYSKYIDLNSAPSAVVGGAVNVIRGNYIENNTDFVSSGANPITIQSSYNSSCKEIGELYGDWDLNISGTVKVSEEIDSEFPAIKNDGKMYHHRWKFAAVKDRGSTLLYKGEILDKQIGIDYNIFKKSVVNIPSPYYSGRMGLARKKMDLSEEGRCVAKFGLERAEFSYNPQKDTYYLSNVVYSNGTKHLYQYDGTRVNKIQSQTQYGTVVGELNIKRTTVNPDLKQVSITSDDGRIAIYALKNPNRRTENCYLLHSLHTNFSPTVQYSYHMDAKSRYKPVTAKRYPDGRFLGVRYKNNKVVELSAPIGVGGTEAPLFQFKRKKEKRQTLVTDANNNKKKYYWTEKRRLSKIVDFNPDSAPGAKDGGAYRSEKFNWMGSSLSTHSLFDSDDIVLLRKCFEYGNYSTILSECITGNLSGHAELRLIHKYYYDINNYRKKCECYGYNEEYYKYYQYNDDHYVTQEDVGFQILNYVYYPTSSNIKLKTISKPDGTIQLRHYYEYNSSGTVVLEITDDGSTGVIDDLTGVTQRLIKKITTTTTKPWGLPQDSSHYYLDLSTNEEVLIKRTLNSYSRRGLLVREETYDCNDSFAYAKEWKHNTYGQVIEETNEIGNQTLYKYDANGNCIFKQTPNPDYYTVYEYSHMNLLLKEIQVHLDGRSFAKSYVYDRNGNVKKSYDYCGNKTGYDYDSFNRLVCKTFPANIEKKGRLRATSERYGYNELNYPTYKKDDRGSVKIITNAYGKPAFISYPDGSTQRIVYNLDGTAEKTIDSLGNETHFEYDYQCRKISERKYSSDGEELSTKRWVYGAFNLLMEVDPEGYVTAYEYDGAGRLITQTKEGSEVRFVYDSLGRQTEKWEQCGEDSWRVSSVKFDLLGQVIEESIENGDGTVFMKKQYAYDVDQNRTHESIFTKEGVSTTITEFNAHKQPVKVITPDGNETTYHYDYEHINAFGQAVLREEVVDAKGNSAVKIHDARGFTVLEEQKNIYDTLVKKTEYLNDCVGNVLKRIESVIVEDKVVRIITTHFEYDSMGREVAVIEAYGEPEQKISRKSYTILGDVQAIIKPNGTELIHTYDSLGRLHRLTSSDKAIDYVYTYDRNHNILQVKDGVVE